MKAPEKLYLEGDDQILDLFPVLNLVSTVKYGNEVEYIRKDAFIEKDCLWLKDNTDRYLYNTGGIDEYKPKCGGKMIEDFKEYLKK